MEHTYRNALASLIKAVRADSEGLNDELEQAEILLEQDEQPTGQLKLTPGTWKVSTHDDNGDIVIRDAGNKIVANLSTDKYGKEDEEYQQSEADAQAIVKAVNNTFGKGINPEAVEGMFNALKATVARINGEWDNSTLVAYGLLGEMTSDILRVAQDAIQSATIK